MSGSIDLMFDAPGPQGVRRARIAGIVSSLILIALVWLVLQRFYDVGGLAADKWQVFTTPGVRDLLTTALLGTLKAAASAGILALALGTFLALLRMSSSRIVRGIVTAYVEVTRSLPTLLVLYFTVLFLPYWGLRIPVYWQLVIALVITNAALISELLRASLLSVPKGQTEATLSLGLTRPRALQLIVLPQAFRAASPALIAQLVYLLKGTTLGYVISYEELLFNSRVIGEYTENLLQAFIVAIAIFLIVNLALSRGAVLLQRKLSSRGISSSGPALTGAAE